jgi:hypothetical protein
MKLTQGNWPVPFEYLFLVLVAALGVVGYIAGLKEIAFGILYSLIIVICVMFSVNYWKRITVHPDPDEEEPVDDYDHLKFYAVEPEKFKKSNKKQRLIRKPFHCVFYNGPCKKDECASFEPMRPKTLYEQQQLLAQDIPITDPYVKNWCNRYQTCVRDRIIIEEY